MRNYLSLRLTNTSARQISDSANVDIRTQDPVFDRTKLTTLELHDYKRSKQMRDRLTLSSIFSTYQKFYLTVNHPCMKIEANR